MNYSLESEMSLKSKFVTELIVKIVGNLGVLEDTLVSNCGGEPDEVEAIYLLTARTTYASSHLQKGSSIQYYQNKR